MDAHEEVNNLYSVQYYFYMKMRLHTVLEL